MRVSWGFARVCGGGGAVGFVLVVDRGFFV